MRIEAYLPKAPVLPKKALIQARVDPELLRQVRVVLHLRKLTWNALIEACLRKFIDETKGKVVYEKKTYTNSD